MYLEGRRRRTVLTLLGMGVTALLVAVLLSTQFLKEARNR